MAELEIHHEAEGSADPLGQKIGLLAAVIAVALAIVTIASHRAHTEGVLLKASANDRWSFYQSKRIKFHSLELGADLMGVLGPKDDVTRGKIEAYHAEQERYERESKEVLEEARKKEQEATLVERKALRFDFGEGLLEIALVLTSLYFISKKMLFPGIGIVAGVVGVLAAAAGWMM
jgi:hypothetical protein